MLIKCWGARGSLPVSGPEFDKYGGNTTCLEIRSSEGDVLVVDAGTGIRKLGNQLAKEKVKDINMIFTHAHWDHIMGFPFFMPIYNKDTNIKICGCSCAQESISNLVARTMEQPFFPINYDQLASNIEFAGECQLKFNIGSIQIETIILNHPQNGLGYKFTEGGKSFVFLTDNELSFKHPNGLEFDDYLRFSDGADFLIHDSEYRASEYSFTRGWGHSLYTDALELALKANVRKFGLFHHNVDRTDDVQDEILEDCKRIIKERGSKLECIGTNQYFQVEL
jgi:phosphoribosyl 1,2-cyclic phosphodiesterase